MQQEQVIVLLRNLLAEVTPETSPEKFRKICRNLQIKYHPDHDGNPVEFKMCMSQINYLKSLKGKGFPPNWFECWKKSTYGIEFISSHCGELEQAHGDEGRSNQGSGHEQTKSRVRKKYKTKPCRYGKKCQSGNQCTFIHQYDDNQGGKQKDKDCFEEVTTLIENYFCYMPGIKMVSLTKCKKFEGYFAACRVYINGKKNCIYIESHLETASPFDLYTKLYYSIEGLELEQMVR
jgi:hypothetical protein